MFRKKRWVMTVLLFLFLCLAVAALIRFADRRETMRFAARLGSGINIGNSFDVYGAREYIDRMKDIPYETAWGNPAISRELLSSVRKAGFSTVRIPVTWADHMDEDGEIQEEWLSRVQEVVDLALREGLYVILDTHHEEWISLEQAAEAEVIQRFCSLWAQIARHFRSYDERLLFEGMNEPRLRESEEEWTAGTPKLQAVINRLNRAFVETVRAEGGENKKRYLLICPYGNNTGTEALEALEVPKVRVMISVHMYEPYWFCQDEEGSAQWSGSRQREAQQKVEETFEVLNSMFLRKGVPVILTEFGCTDKGNTESRREWIACYKELAAENKISCIWWDNGSTYRLFDRDTGEEIYPILIEEIVK